MKVLYIGGFELPDGNAAAQRVIANAKILVELGFEVRLVGLSKTSQKEIFEYEGLSCQNYLYPEALDKWLKYLCSIKAYSTLIQEWKPELVIAYNYPAVALWRLLHYCRNNGIKLVADCTEWYQGRGNFFFNLLKNSDTTLRMKVVQPKLDGIIVISKYLYNYYADKNSHVLLLPPLVDKANPKWEIASQSREEYVNLKLLYAGTTSRKDRLDIIIKALRRIVPQLPFDVELDIIGMEKEKFQKLYPSIGEIPNYVRFHGRLPHQQVLTMLANHDYQIFIREETRPNMAGFPTKFVESISSGTLVLTNYTSDLSDYLKASVNGYPLDISSEKSLEESLLIALKVNKKDIKRMKDNLDTNFFDYHKYMSQSYQFLDGLGLK